MSENGALLVAGLVVGAAAWWALRPASVSTVNGDWINEATYAGGVVETDNAPDWTDYGLQAVDMGAALFDGNDEMKNQNLAAFLWALRLGEGTTGPNGYRTLCGGDLFESYEAHPAALGWRGFPLRDSVCAGAGFGPGCVSTAAGAFQINKPTYNRVAPKIGVSGFAPAVQDAIAVQLITEKGALADVLAGRVEAAVFKVRKIWASLPGAGYAGQHTVSLAAFNQQFINAGGVMA